LTEIRPQHPKAGGFWFDAAWRSFPGFSLQKTARDTGPLIAEHADWAMSQITRTTNQ